MVHEPDSSLVRSQYVCRHGLPGAVDGGESHRRQLDHTRLHVDVRQLAPPIFLPLRRPSLQRLDQRREATNQHRGAALPGTEAQPRRPLGLTQRTQAILRRQLLEATDRGVQALPASILDAVDAAMDRQALPPVPGVLHNAGVADVGHLLDHVQLAHTVDALFFSWQLGQHVTVFVIEVTNGAQPAVDQAELTVLHRGAHAAAAVVAGNEDVFDLEHVHCVLDHRQAIEVGVQHYVGHVAVHEQIPRQHADDLVGRHTGVGTADPQVFRSLLAGELGEEFGIFLFDRIRPSVVVIKQVL